MGKTIKVGLFWHSLNSSNLGIGALTVSHMEIIADAARSRGLVCEFHIICWPPEEGFFQDVSQSLEIHYMKAKDFIKPWSALHRWIKHCDVIFDIGAGDSFADLYGSKRFYFLSATKIFSLLHGKKLILAPQTIGPYIKPFNRWLATRLMHRCERVYARDETSLSFLRELGVRDNIGLTTDVAFRLPYTPAPNEQNGKVRVGLNASALLYSEIRSGSDYIQLSIDYPKLINNIIETLLRRSEVELYLIAHVIAGHLAYENDQVLAEQLQQRFPQAKLAPRFHGPSEAKDFISGMNLLLASRMHASIAAVSSGVPILPLSYSRKFTGLYASLGYPYVCDLTLDDEDAVMLSLEKVLNELPWVQECTSESQAQALEKLASYQDDIAHILEAL